MTNEQLLGAIARGWCAPANAGKAMDAELARAIAAEVQAAIAAQPPQPTPDSPEGVSADNALEGVAEVVEPWQPIETAPKGSGEDGPASVTHPKYIKPPSILLLTSEGEAITGYYDWYYHPGYGSGAAPDESPWRAQPDGVSMADVTHWMPLPPPPAARTGSAT